MTKKDKTAVAKKEAAGVPALPFDYGEHAGKGTKELTQTERGLPFLKILQAQSPEVIGPEGKVDGAAAGMFFNTGTGELIQGAVRVLPAIRMHVIQNWRPRGEGGGLASQVFMTPGDDYPQHYKDAKARCEAEGRNFGDFWMGEPKKSEKVSECFQLFCIVLDGDNNPIGMAVVPFSSTAITPYKKQYTRRIGSLRGAPPIYAFPIDLTTTQQSNDEGTWFNYVITFPVENNPVKSALDPNSDAFKAAAELHTLVSSGIVTADIAQDPGGTNEPTGDDSVI